MNKEICKGLRRLAEDSVGQMTPYRDHLAKLIKDDKGNIIAASNVNSRDSVRGRYQMLKRLYQRDPEVRKKLDNLMAYVRVLRANTVAEKNGASFEERMASLGKAIVDEFKPVIGAPSK